MIRAYGSQIVRGGGGRIKIRPYSMIRAYGSQWLHLKKCKLSLNLFETCRIMSLIFRYMLFIICCNRRGDLGMFLRQHYRPFSTEYE